MWYFKMIRLDTYTLPRPFFNYNIPIAIQSSYLRDYAQKNDYIFRLPVTEIVKKDCFYMFIKHFTKKKINLGLVSIFMLPINNEKLFHYLLTKIHTKTNFHFVLENLILDKKKLILWREEYLPISMLPKCYDNFPSNFN